MSRAMHVNGAVCSPAYRVISYRSYNIASSFAANAYRGDNIDP